MNSVKEVLPVLDAVLTSDELSNLLEFIVRECWQRRKPCQFAQTIGYDDNYIGGVGLQF